MTDYSNATPDGAVAQIFTPLNLVLFSLLVYIVFIQFQPRSIPALPKRDPPIVFRTFTPPELLEYDGTNGKPIYFAVRGRVFDVSPGRGFYGPGGHYSNFAGRDASKGLAHSSFDSSMLTENLNGPLEPLDKLNAEQKESLKGWEDKFLEKYVVVGRLVSVDDLAKEK